MLYETSRAISCAVVIQSVVRVGLCRKEAAFRRVMAAHGRRRREGREWSTLRNSIRGTSEKVNAFLVTYSIIEKEKKRIEDELCSEVRKYFWFGSREISPRVIFFFFSLCLYLLLRLSFVNPSCLQYVHVKCIWCTITEVYFQTLEISKLTHVP